jgi:hypothetical protein
MVEGRMAAQIGAVEESRQIRFSPPVVTEILFIMWATVGFLIFIIFEWHRKATGSKPEPGIPVGFRTL